MIFDITPGASASPVILHVPHASRAITPEARAGLLVTDAQLGEELDHLTDAHTDLIAARAAGLAHERPWTFANRWSRLVVDPERFPDDREEMRAVGMGAVYTAGFAGRKLRDDDGVRDEALLRTHFVPYSAALAGLVADRLAAVGRAVIVDVHSYATVLLPYEIHREGARPAVCLGTDRDHTPGWLLTAAQAAFPEHALNTPFAGCYVPLDYYGTDPRVAALMIEIRRDGYMTEPGGPPHAGLDRLAAALAALIDSVSGPAPSGGPPGNQGQRRTR
ncbi:N-formylglutamate amidohydrolase [Actinoplanes sp. KI2]|uniref:N-formylglutamate amidohydrolase n=1 Tax=Actinoplanes sp. KI2 TaxID=2983315 RepID=UPI0021D580C2|nr:N-formylglutamate amidohydrolase [Actinoplanes sp. KI2]MCU7726014.1 N-formylglutamate amidohydrolase [Actinoplanes sp. KI2]